MKNGKNIFRHICIWRIFDIEFEKWTKFLFEKISQGNYKILYSKLTDRELSPAPKKVKDLVLTIPENQIEVVEIRTPREILDYEE